jgi:catechol 2,3-dioxygenase-like lactoylglutathione lyase family enzyme
MKDVGDELDHRVPAGSVNFAKRRECTPDGHGRLELSRFLAPPAIADHRNAPVNALGYLRVMFAVDDIHETLERLRNRGAQLVGEVVQYEDAYRLCYIRGPEGLLIGLAQELS